METQALYIGLWPHENVVLARCQCLLLPPIWRAARSRRMVRKRADSGARHGRAQGRQHRRDCGDARRRIVEAFTSELQITQGFHTCHVSIFSVAPWARVLAWLLPACR